MDESQQRSSRLPLPPDMPRNFAWKDYFQEDGSGSAAKERPKDLTLLRHRSNWPFIALALSAILVVGGIMLRSEELQRAARVAADGNDRAMRTMYDSTPAMKYWGYDSTKRWVPGYAEILGSAAIVAGVGLTAVAALLLIARSRNSPPTSMEDATQDARPRGGGANSSLGMRSRKEETTA